MDHVAGLLHIWWVGKRGEDLVHYNMSQTLLILENYLVVFVCPPIMGFALQSILKSIMLEKTLKKSWSPGIFVNPTSWRWA